MTPPKPALDPKKGTSMSNTLTPSLTLEGFDVVEIPLLQPDEFDSDLIGKELSRKRY